MRVTVAPRVPGLLDVDPAEPDRPSSGGGDARLPGCRGLKLPGGVETAARPDTTPNNSGACEKGKAPNREPERLRKANAIEQRRNNTGSVDKG